MCITLTKEHLENVMKRMKEEKLPVPENLKATVKGLKAGQKSHLLWQRDFGMNDRAYAIAEEAERAAA